MSLVPTGGFSSPVLCAFNQGKRACPSPRLLSRRVWGRQGYSVRWGNLWAGSQVTWLPALPVPRLLVWSQVVSCCSTEGTLSALLLFVVVTGEMSFNLLERLLSWLMLLK